MCRASQESPVDLLLTEDDGTKVVLSIGEIDLDAERKKLVDMGLTPCQVSSVMKFGYLDPCYLSQCALGETHTS